MLKQRVLTALLLIPLVILIVLKLPSAYFCLLTAAITLYGAWEWTYIIGMKSFATCFIYLILMSLFLVASRFLYIPSVLYVTCVLWLIAAVLVSTYPQTSHWWGKGLFIRSVLGFFVLVPCWIALNYIRNFNNGPYLMLFLFVLIWGADSGAYFVGKKWGKTKLAPAVSPGKSWEGFLGAVVTTCFIVLAALWLFSVPAPMRLPIIMLSLITLLFSVLGDLFESMLKRQQGIKDSGQLLPGHGGLLDRIDSLTAAAPVFAFGIYFINHWI